MLFYKSAFIESTLQLEICLHFGILLSISLFVLSTNMNTWMNLFDWKYITLTLANETHYIKYQVYLNTELIIIKQFRNSNGILSHMYVYKLLFAIIEEVQTTKKDTNLCFYSTQNFILPTQW